MFKRLFRLIIVFIILFFINKYTTWFDDTKFGGFFNRFEDKMIAILIKDKNTDNIKENQSNSDTWSLSWFDGIEWFSDDDILGWSEVSGTYDTNSFLPNNYDIVFVDHTNKYCITPWWQRIENDNYIIAYQSPVSVDCNFEKRYCHNGRLDGNFYYHTCLYENIVQIQSQKSLLTTENIATLVASNTFTYQSPVVDGWPNSFWNKPNTWSWSLSALSQNANQDYDMQTQIWPGIVASSYAEKYTKNNQQDSNDIADVTTTYNNPEIHFLWRWEKEVKIKNGQVDLEDTALKTSTLKKILKSWWPTYDSKHIELPISKPNYINKICTTPWWDILSNGQYTIAFDSSWPICKSEIRYCLDGVLKWNYTNPWCDNPDGIIKITTSLDISWVDLNSDECSYYKDTVKYTYWMIDYYKWHNQIPLNFDSDSNINYNYTSTKLPNRWNGCRTDQFGIVPDGTSVIWFESSSAGEKWCIWQVRYCINWVLQWEFPYWYCE